MAYCRPSPPGGWQFFVFALEAGLYGNIKFESCRVHVILISSRMEEVSVCQII